MVHLSEYMAHIDIILPYLLQDKAIPERYRKEFISVIKGIDKKEDSDKTSEEWFVQGYMSASQDEYDQAEDCFSEAIRLNPNFEAAWKQRGDMKLGSGASKYAIEDYTKAIELDPEYTNAYLKRAQAWLDQNQPDKAEKDLNAVRAMDPDSSQVLMITASIQEKQGKYEDALASYDKALQNTPKDTQILNARALIHLFYGDPEKAASDFLKIQAIEGSNYVNSFNLGLSFGQISGKWKEAFQYFDKAFKKNPDLLKNYFDSAQEFETKRLKNALTSIQDKVSAVPSSDAGAFYRNELIQLLDRKMSDVR
jgi:tetratricopeptide (TPR) repeat protein